VSAGDVRRLIAEHADMWLVAVGNAPGLVDAEDLADVSGLPMLASVRHDKGLASALERGDGPSVGRGSRLARLGADVLLGLGIDGGRR
jgi:hypothetical protein